MSEHYKKLGLDKDCAFSDVKDAYRNLSMKYHPDINGDNDDNVKKFYEITEAYNEIKKDLKKICRLLKIGENEPPEQVKIEYKKKLEEMEFRVKMGNPGAKQELAELKEAYKFFCSANKSNQDQW